MPLRRYQMPSRVRQTSSASIFPPAVRRMIALPPLLGPFAGPPVETGFRLDDVCDVAVRPGEGFEPGDGDADGDGEVETPGDGDGDGTSDAGSSEAVATGMSVGDLRVSLYRTGMPSATRTTTAIKRNFTLLRRGLIAASISESSTTTRGVLSKSQCWSDSG